MNTFDFVSMKECEDIVNSVLPGIRYSGYLGRKRYELSPFDFDGERLRLAIEICEMENERGSNYGIYYTMEYGSEFELEMFRGCVHTERLDVDELKEKVFEIANTDFSSSIRSLMNWVREGRPVQKVRHANDEMGNSYVGRFKERPDFDFRDFSEEDTPRVAKKDSNLCSVSMKECEGIVNDALRDISRDGWDRESGCYELNSFEVDDERLKLVIEIREVENEYGRNYAISYTVEYDDFSGRELLHACVNTERLDAAELKRKVFEIANTDFSRDVRKEWNKAHEGSLEQKIQHAKDEMDNPRVAKKDSNLCSVSMKECEGIVNDALRDISRDGWDRKSLGYELNAFKVDGDVLGLGIEIREIENEYGRNYAISYTVYDMYGKKLLHDCVHTERLDVDELKEKVFEIANTDFSQDVRVALNKVPEGSLAGKIRDAENGRRVPAKGSENSEREDR